MVVCVDDADGAQVKLADGLIGIYAEGAADAAERPLPRRVCELRVAAERVSGNGVDELTKCALVTRETADRADAS